MFSTRHIIKLIGAVVCLAGVPTLTSCVDELFPRQSTDEIRFVPTVSDSWAAMGRSQSSPFRKAFEEYTVEKIEGSQGADGEQLYLHTQVQEGFQTNDPKIVPDEELKSRATLTTGTTFPYDEFRVSAYLFKDKWDENGYNANYFQEEVVRRNTDGTFDLMSKFFWPNQDGQKMRFRAYAPYTPEPSNTPETPNTSWICEYKTDQPRRIDGVTIKDEKGDTIYFSGVYVKTVSDLSQQRDVLIATTPTKGEDCRNHTNVQLTFKHALAAIRFVANGGLTGATVKSIEFENFWHSGVIDMEKEWLECQWDAAKLEFNINKYISSDDPVDLLDGQVMLFPPYKSLGWSHIWLNIEVNGVTKRVDIPFFHKTWEAGKTYTYRISNKDYTEFIDAQYGSQLASLGNIHMHYPYTGGSQTLDLFSYIGGTTPKPLAWKVSFQPEGTSTWSETPPTWLSVSPNSGAGAAVGSTPLTITTKPIDPVEVDLDAALKKSQNGTPSQRYNLTNCTSDNAIGTTANCYVADRWGYYKFPLVYGNAVTNGSLNDASYLGVAGSSYDSDVMPTFIDHLGNPISGAYIEGHGIHHGPFTVARAGILWEDVPGLIEDVQYVKNAFNHQSISSGAITFNIPFASVKQGNAVIALYDNADRIIWSWHIWVSPLGDKYIIPILSHDYHQFDMSAVNLGWVSFNKIKDYRARTCKVRFSSITGLRDVQITVGQEPHAVLAPGGSMFYQWGRKDPFRGIDRNSNIVNVNYGRPTDDGTKAAKSKQLAWRINNPAKFHKMAIQHLTEAQRKDFDQLAGLTDDLYVNLWDAQNKVRTENNVYTSIKTVYDPCPPGFKVAPPYAFSGMIKIGGESDKPDTWNGNWDDSQKGLVILSTMDHLISSYFPAEGYRDYDDNANFYNQNTDGYYWTSGAWNSSGGIYVHFKQRQFIYLYNRFIQGNAYNIRAVRDKTPEVVAPPARSRFRGPRSWGGGF